LDVKENLSGTERTAYSGGRIVREIKREKVKNGAFFCLKMELGRGKLAADKRGIRGFRVQFGRVGRWVAGVERFWDGL
jgi:hypothetical protein